MIPTRTKPEPREPWLTPERLGRIMFDAFAPAILSHMSDRPQRTRAIAEAAQVSREDALWVLQALTTGHVLVERRGDWWRLTENGQKAMRGEPAPEAVAA